MDAPVKPALLPTTELVALWRRLGTYPNLPDRKAFGEEEASSPIEIVPFQPRYREGIASVILPIQQSELSIPITLDAQPDLQDIPGHYQKDNGNFWVALDQERVVGTVALLDIGHRQGALRQMFVSRAYRGAAHGVSGALVETLLAWCRERGLRQVFLGTPSKLPAAHRFCEKHGFRPVAREQLPARFPALALEDRFYMRAL
jgi:N-acetylglutamate synthase-like GNAT family acetyltransferase